MRTLWAVAVCASIAACGNDGKDNGGSGTIDAKVNTGPDAPSIRDAPPTMNAQITISGTATERNTSGGGALGGVRIEVFRNADETTPIAMTMTDGFGVYSLTIDTNGESVDGFLKATLNGFITTYLYPPYPIGEDFSNASVNMVTQVTWDQLDTITQAHQMEGKGVIALVITDGTNPVGGATASSNPASNPKTYYNQVVGNLTVPTATSTVTHTDGIAYLFNLPPGQVTVSAQKTGSTFASHNAKAWPDQLTTTVIVPP